MMNEVKDIALEPSLCPSLEKPLKNTHPQLKLMMASKEWVKARKTLKWMSYLIFKINKLWLKPLYQQQIFRSQLKENPKLNL